MRYFSILLFLCFALNSCSQKEVFTFTITGNVTNSKSDYLLLHQKTNLDKKINTFIDTVFMDKKGNFSYKSNLESSLYNLKYQKNNIVLAISKNQNITVKIKELPDGKIKTEITGSKETNALIAYEKFRKKSLDRLVNSVRKEVKLLKENSQPDLKKIVLLQEKEIVNYKKHLTELNEFIKSSDIKNGIGLYATSIRWNGGKYVDLYDKITSNFETKFPNLTASKNLREKVNRLKKTAIGGTISEITMKSDKGNLVALSEVHKKYTLVNFWASWCAPCRGESHLLNELYKKYQKKGFEIYDISLDARKNSWLKGIEEDKRNWINVSSLKVFKTKAAYNYAVTSLPSNYLIDQNNKIIGKNLHGKDLEDLLASLMK
jgi:thiol-disulfide isomerase/thioredoxin